MILLLCGLVRAQCPTISLRGVPDWPRLGSASVYLARLSGVPAGITPTFDWKVDGAEILDGQGTNALELRRTSDRLHISVKVNGIGQGCVDSASETGYFDRGPMSTKLAEFTGPLRSRPHEELEGLARILKNDPSAQLYVVISGDAKHRDKSRIAKRELMLKRLASLFGGKNWGSIVEHPCSTDDRTTIWLVPAGAIPPH